MKGISFPAVLVGFIVDLLLSSALAFIITIVLAVYTMQESHNPGHFDSAAFDRLVHSDPVLHIDTAGGAVTSFIGGALTGWFARTHCLKNASALAVAELVSTLPFLPFMKAYPLWFTIGDSMVAVAFILLGGYISQLIFGDKGLA